MICLTTRPGLGVDDTLERRDMALHTARTVAMNTAPPKAPAIAGTRTFLRSCSTGGGESPDEESDKAREGGLGHKLEGIPWAEHAATVAAENRESTSEGF